MAGVQASSPILAILPGAGQLSGAGSSAGSGEGVFSQLLSGQMADAGGLPLQAAMAQAGLPGMAGLLTALSQRLGRGKGQEGLEGLLQGVDGPLPPGQGAEMLAAWLAGQMAQAQAAGADGSASVDGDGRGLEALAAVLERALPDMATKGRGKGVDAAGIAALGKGLPAGALADAGAGGDPLAFDATLDTALTVGAQAGAGGESAAGAGQEKFALMTAGVGRESGSQQLQEAPVLAVRTPIQSQAWGSEVGQKIVWLAGQHAQSAELTLNPPHLGSLEVKLTLTGQEAGAQFFSPHPAVREALESAIPRLREMMAEAGLSLGQASVSPESFRDQRPGQDGQKTFARGDGAELEVVGEGAASGQAAHVRPLAGNGLVDFYA